MGRPPKAKKGPVTDSTGQIVPTKGKETQTLALAQKNVYNTIMNLQGDIARILPSHMNAERYARQFYTNVRRNPELAFCTIPSLMGCMLEAAAMGMEVGTKTGHASMVPFNNKKKGVKEAQLMIEYKGWVSMMWNSDRILSINPGLVYKGDKFDYKLGTDAFIDHYEGDESGIRDSDITHAYIIFEFTNGGKQFKVMTRQQIERYRRMSKAAQSNFWINHYGPMALKTVLHRMRAWLPISTEIIKAMDRDEARDSGDPSFSDETVEAMMGAGISVGDIENVDEITGEIEEAPEPPPAEPEPEPEEEKPADSTGLTEEEKAEIENSEKQESLLEGDEKPKGE